MPERRRRPDLTPRWLTIGEAAQYLGHSPSWLNSERLARLQETGFPVVDSSLERIDREAIDDWSDRRSGRQRPSPAEENVAPAQEDAASSQAEGKSTLTSSDDPWVRAARELRDGKIRN
jgi:hypothetical protein